MKLFVRLALAFLGIWCAASGFASKPATPLSLPITFEENRGQVSPAYSYVFHHGLTALFSPQGIDLTLPSRHGHAGRLRVEFPGAAPHPALTAGMPLKGQSNYLLGSNPSGFLTHIAQYGVIHYSELYPGVQLDFHGKGSELEHDFTLSPHADPTSIALRFRGALGERLTGQGDLVVETSDGSLILKRPVAYQADGDQRTLVEASFQKRSDGSVGFRLGLYNAARPLVIDPVFSFSTYLDGEYSDQISAVTTDTSGNIYVTGTTASPDFPIQSGEQPHLGCSSNSTSCTNAFITKLNPTGTQLLYSTFIGGSAQDQGASIVVDSSGNAIIGGVSSSSDFPRSGLPQLSCQINDSCYFLTSLKADGSALNYSGLIGGIEGSSVNGTNGRVAVDGAGNAYLAGVTDDPHFAITPGTLATSVPGYPFNSTFVLKVSPTGQLLYSTIIPGTAAQNPAQAYTNWFLPSAITVDSSSQVTVAGTGGTGLPTTPGTVSPTFPNPTANQESPIAGYLLQLNATASAINFGSYIPGTDQLGGMAADSSGNIYVTGATYEATLPVSSNAYQATPAMDRDGVISSGYVARLSPGAASVTAATYLDGLTPALNNQTVFQALALDSSGNVYLGGMTGSSDFPMVAPFVAEFETSGTNVEMVLAELSSDLSTLRFGSFLSSVDGVFPGTRFSGLAIDGTGHFLVTGTTDAPDFPTTPGSFMPTPPSAPGPTTGYVHSFLSRLDMATAAPSVCPASSIVSLGTVTALTSYQQTFNITNCGNAPLTIGSIASSVSAITAAQSCGSIAPGSTCPVTLTFAPVDATLSSGALTFTDNAAIPTQVVQVSGQGSAPNLQPSPGTLSLGHLLAGTSGPQQTLVLYNNGNAALLIQSISLSGSGFTLQQGPCLTSVPAQSACAISVAFAPASAGAFTASVNIHSNDPVHPQLAIPLTGTGDSTYATPAVTGIAEPLNQYPLQTIQVQSGTPQQILLYGNNFYPQSVVRCNGTIQATTFVSNSLLQVTVASSSLTALGDLPVSVANPSPGGGSSATSTLTGYLFLPFANITALASVPSSGKLYVAISATDPSNPNTVMPIDAATGTMGTPILVGKDPVRLAPSSDGSYLYVANDGDSTVQRINLQTNVVDKTFAYAPASSCSFCIAPPATDLKSLPGSPTEFILAQGGQVALYNESGLVNYVPNAFVPIGAPSFTSIAFAGSPLALYAQPFTTGQNPFFTTVAITSSGLQFTPVTGANYGPPTGTGSQVASDGTLLYTDSGEVWDPATQKKIATFGASLIYDSPGDILLDTTLGSIYLAGLESLTRPDGGGTYIALAVNSFSQKSLATETTLTFPLVNSAETFDLTRWGSNGFAFAVPVPDQGSSGVYIFNSNALVTLAANPVPTVGTISPDVTAAGSSAFTLTVNGTGLLSSSAISWNGSPLPTSYVSATQLTASVPASLVATAGTAQVTVTNPTPGGGTSQQVAFNILPAAPAASLSATTLSFGSVLAGSSSVPQTLTLTNSGSAPLAISSVNATGPYSQTNNCPASLASGALCRINVTFTPTASGSLPGTIALATNAPGSPQTITLTGTGTAPVSITAGSGGSTSQTVTSGATATYHLSLTGASSFSGNVALSCTGAPQGATCSVTPSSLNLTSGGTGSFTVSVSTQSSTTSASVLGDRTPTALAGLAGAALLLLPLSRRIRKGKLLLSLCLLAAACLLFSATGCGGGPVQTSSTSPSTPKGTYTLLVTAAAQGASIQQPLTLTVD